MSTDRDSMIVLPRRHRPMGRALGVIPSLMIGAALLAAWQVYAVEGDLGPDVLPSPTRVVEQGWRHRAALWNNMLPTLHATLIGFGLSLVVGFVFSVLIDASKIMRRALLPPWQAGSRRSPLCCPRC